MNLKECVGQYGLRKQWLKTTGRPDPIYFMIVYELWDDEEEYAVTCIDRFKRIFNIRMRKENPSNGFIPYEGIVPDEWPSYSDTKLIAKEASNLPFGVAIHKTFLEGEPDDDNGVSTGIDDEVN